MSRSSFVSVVILLLFGCFVGVPYEAPARAETTQKKVIPLPAGALNAQQIQQQFAGKTALAKFAVKDKIEVYYFAEDGEVIEIRNGWQKSGKWSVRDDGRLCIDLQGEHRDCRLIIKDGGQYHQYAAKLDGNHRYEQTYLDFLPGEQLQKMSPKPILPQETLKSEEVIKLFSGMTVESVTASQGRVSHTYYSPDGKVVQMRKGVERKGTWRVNSRARMCLKMEGLQEKCRIIVKADKDYKKYIVKKNGRHQHSVTYRSFLPGKQF